MTWVALGGAAIVAGGSIGAAAISSKGGKGGGSNASQYDPGEYDIRPEYEEAQKYMKELGIDIMGGNLPDYYKPIGEYGGPELEGVIGKAKGDISENVQTDIARRGVSRGGVGATAIGKATADILPGLRYADYERAMGARRGLLGLGVETMSNVKTGEFNVQQAQNQYLMDRFRTYAGVSGQQAQLEQQQQAARSGMWQQMASSGIGAVGQSGMFGSGANANANVPARQVTSQYTNPNIVSGDFGYGYRT